jgi:hypothetical protein
MTTQVLVCLLCNNSASCAHPTQRRAAVISSHIVSASLLMIRECMCVCLCCSKLLYVRIVPQFRVLVNIHIHTSIHIHMQIYTQTYTHAHIYIYMLRLYTHVHVRTHTC